MEVNNINIKEGFENGLFKIADFIEAGKSKKSGVRHIRVS